MNVVATIINRLFDAVIGQLPGVTITILVIVALTLYIYSKPLLFEYWENKFKKWTSHILWFLSRIFKNLQYKALTSEIESAVNSFVSEIERRTGTPLPRVHLKLIRPESTEALEWEDGEAILIVKDRKNRDKNLVHAAFLFTSETVLRRTRHHLSKTQKLSADLHVAMRVLEKSGSGPAEYFRSEFVLPRIEKNENIRTFLKKYENIDRKGLFFPILIQELNYLGVKIFLEKPSEEIIKEVNDLIDFLEQHSLRRDRELTRTKFLGKYLRCAIHICASTPTVERGNITGHREVLQDIIKNHRPEDIYLIGSANSNNRAFMHRVGGAVMEDFPSLQEKRVHKFIGGIIVKEGFKRVETALIHLHNPPAVQHSFTTEDLETRSDERLHKME